MTLMLCYFLQACDRLLAMRVEQKMKGKKVGDVLNRLHVAVPQKRDAKDRPPCIPEKVLKKRAAMDTGEKRKLVSYEKVKISQVAVFC